MDTRSLSRYLLPPILVLGALLVAGNWYLQPERGVAWALAALVVVAMTAALAVGPVRTACAGTTASAAAAIQNAVLFTGSVLVLVLAARLARTLGVGGEELPHRLSMIIAGGYLAVTGNALPKTLRPLSTLRCDGARLQAFQRLAGWTWVLTGVALAAAWIVLPLQFAKPVSVVLLLTSVLIVGGEVIRRRWFGTRRA